MKAKKYMNVMNYNDKHEKNNPSIEIVCRGCNMRNRQYLWSYFNESKNNGYNNSYLIFEEEPTNQYDPNAIMIVSKGEVFGTLGYVGKEFTGKVKEILTQCKYFHLDIINEEEVGEKEIRLSLQYITD